MHPFQEMSEKLEALNEIGIALSSETDLSRLLELIVKETRSFSNADAGSLYLVDQETKALHFEVAQNDTLETRPDISVEPFKPYSLALTKNSIAGYVAIAGEILNIPDAYNLSPRVGYEFNKDFDLRNNYRTKSILVVPMKDTEGKIFGVLQLINSIDGRGKVTSFEPSIESLVLSLASQAAVAIKNAQLIKEIKALFEALIQYSVSAIDARSPFTAGHSRRVACYTSALANAVNQTYDGPFADISFSPVELEELNYAAWLHDIGKIGVREGVLDKKNRLSDAETATLITRFETIKASAIIETQKKIFPLLQGNEREVPQVTALTKDLKKQLIQIDDDLDFLKKVSADNFLSESKLKRLDMIRDKKFLDTKGRERNYLTDLEYENLSVQKGNLTMSEIDEIRSHAIQTENIVSKIPFTGPLKNVPVFAAAHHEMLDGSGYPKHITAGMIPLQTRIITLSDIYEALVAKDRPYKKSMSMINALDVLKEEADKGRIDAELVRIFIEKRVYETKTDD